MAVLDELDAYAALIDRGQSEDDVARQFGVTVLHVRQRLKPARVSPVIREAFRDGTINLDPESLRRHRRFRGAGSHLPGRLRHEHLRHSCHLTTVEPTCRPGTLRQGVVMLTFLITAPKLLCREQIR